MPAEALAGAEPGRYVRSFLDQEIGERLLMALDTVRGHNRRSFDERQARRRTEAVARARGLGLL